MPSRQDQNERLHLIVEGRVQGVCFRMGTVDEAQRLRLTGWVRNRPDGNVEVVAEGPPRALDALQAWCGHGPSLARVTRLRVDRAPATGAFPDFSVKYR